MPFSSSAEIQIGTQQPPPATPGFSSAEIHAASRHALLLRRDPGRDAAGAASATPQPSPPPRSTPPQPPAADASPGFSSALGFHRSPRRPSPAAVAGHHDCAARADAATRARDRDPGPPRDLPQRLQGPLRVAAVGAPPPAGDHGGEAEPEPHVGRGDRVPRRRRRRGVRCIRAQRGPLLRHRVPGEGAGAPHRDHGDGRPLARHQVVPAPAQERRQVQEEELAQVGYSSPSQQGNMRDLDLSLAEYSAFGSILTIGAMLGAIFQ